MRVAQQQLEHAEAAVAGGADDLDATFLHGCTQLSVLAEQQDRPCRAAGECACCLRPCYGPAVVPLDRGRAPAWVELLALDDSALLAQCEFDRFRASGPGGQKRNVTDSGVRLRHRASGLAAQASESRSQHENRARALGRLRRAIALTLRAPLDAAELERYLPPPALAGALHPQRGLAPGRRDARFLPALAALLDLLEAVQWRTSAAAGRLGVSTASLTRFLAQDATVLRAANERRRALGLRPLRA
ncbi:MAG: peptide chain release factor-like protein [Dehalococcoidia bacterium]|nr:peptide chain release factor-like protein [Dehalococcoidia bacterium]